ncbi:hypothetical protein ACFQGT_14515 [Natrialbaceae archaeon GCM10025810]|uniref:hypothetical protein n=1 Tax=Halovalidus salilacus TaxID=3075124 RepID=UPI0036221C9A
MSNRAGSRITVEHSDSLSTSLSRYDGDGEYSVDITHRLDVENSEYGVVGRRGEDISIEHPVEDEAELSRRAHLTVQFAQANQERRQESGGPGATTGRESCEVVFNESVLELAEPSLEAKGVTVESFPVAEQHVKAMLLYDAWKMRSWQALTDHIDDRDGLAASLGYESVPDQSTFWRVSKSLEEAGMRGVIESAATQAVDAIVCVGLAVPESATETWTRYRSGDRRANGRVSDSQSGNDWVGGASIRRSAGTDFVRQGWRRVPFCGANHRGDRAGRIDERAELRTTDSCVVLRRARNPDCESDQSLDQGVDFRRDSSDVHGGESTVHPVRVNSGVL